MQGAEENKKGKTVAVVKPELPLEPCSLTQKGKDLHRSKPGKNSVHRQVFVLRNKLEGCKTRAIAEDSKRKSQRNQGVPREELQHQHLP